MLFRRLGVVLLSFALVGKSPVPAVAGVNDPLADCTRTLFKKTSRDERIALQSQLLNLAEFVRTSQQLNVTRADHLLTDVWWKFPNNGPLNTPTAVEHVLKTMRLAESKGPSGGKDHWDTLIRAWSDYLQAISKDLDLASGWTPCGWQDEAKSFKTDMHYLFAPVTVWGDIRKSHEAGSGLAIYFVPVAMVMGAVSLIGDTLTLAPNIGGRAVQRITRKAKTYDSDAAWQHILEILA